MVVILDPQNSGIAGNMVVGALVDLGIEPEPVVEIMENSASYFGDIDVKIMGITKSGISATYVDVRSRDTSSIDYPKLNETLKKIKDEKIDTPVLKFAKKIFKTLAEAEAKVHGTHIDKVHFHEVGAADAVADILGSAYCFYELGFNAERIYGMPIALGGGRIESMHGSFSVPAPATMEILRNLPVFGGPVDHELTTPTGAALYVNMVDEVCDFYPMIANKNVGYGAGKMDLDVPNVLRVLVGSSPIPTDKISILETNLDDVTGEILGYTVDRLLEEGALDVTIIPTITKKNRPGHLLRVITKSNMNDVLSETIIRETGTLGVRIIPYVHRNIVKRKIIPIEVLIDGEKKKVRVKVAMIGEEIINITAEYEDAKKISEEMGIPLKDVIRIINKKVELEDSY